MKIKDSSAPPDALATARASPFVVNVDIRSKYAVFIPVFGGGSLERSGTHFYALYKSVNLAAAFAHAQTPDTDV